MVHNFTIVETRLVIVDSDATLCTHLISSSHWSSALKSILTSPASSWLKDSGTRSVSIVLSPALSLAVEVWMPEMGLSSAKEASDVKSFLGIHHLDG